MIAVNETLEILGFILDNKGTWSAHVDRTVKEARQRLGAISRVRGCLNDNGVYTAYKAFVWPKLEYGSLIYWSRTKSHLAKLDQVQQQAHRHFEGFAITSVQQRREAATVGLTCRLLSRDVKRPLESLTPKLKDPSEGRLRRSASWEDTSNSTSTSYSVRQPPDHWRYSKEVSEAEYTMSGMT